MADFPAGEEVICPVLSTSSLWAAGGNMVAHTLSSVTSTAWVAANRAIFTPVTLPCPFTVRSVWSYNGSSVAGNIDIGVYSLDGALILSSGSTAQSGTSAPQIISVTEKTLVPGSYYLAMACSSVSATVQRHGYGVAGGIVAGLLQAATNMPLANSPTFARIATSSSFIYGVASITSF